MAYNITSTSGLTSYTITNGAINDQTDLSFIGKGALNYGSSLNTNFLRLLENFADVTEPGTPITGQLWWDTSTNNLRVYDGATFSIVSPPLDRITSSTIGNLEIVSSSITGEIVDGNINIGPNGTGNTVINRLAILNTGVGKVLYTAANGMIVTSTLSFNPTDNTLTATNLSATNIAGTLTTGPQAAITSVGTLGSLAVTGNITAGNVATSGNVTAEQLIGYHTGAIGANIPNTGVFTTLTITGGLQNTPIGNGTPSTGEFTSVTTTSGGQLSGYLTGAIGANVANTGVFTSMIGNSLSLSSSSPTLFTMTSSATTGGLRANLITTGSGSTSQPVIVFSRTSTSTTAFNGGLGWIKTLTDGSATSSSIYVVGTNNASTPVTQMQFTSPNGFSFTGTSGTTTIDTYGNVGIGTASTSYPLTISKSGVNTYLYQYDGTGSQVTGVNGAGLGISGTFSNTDMAFFSNSLERIRITSGGNIGIGNSSPITQLHLNANGYAAVYLGNNDSTGFHVTKETTDNSFNIWSGTFGSGTNRFKIDSVGNVSISGNTNVSGTITASGPASSAPLALTDGTTITPNFALRNNFSVTLGGNRTLANPGNITVGQSGIIYISQDGTGSRTLSYGTYWKFPSGVAPTLTATANATDALVYFVRTATSITVSYLLNIG